MMNLETFFKQYPRAAVAFSGGVDSSYLLYAASQYAEDYKAYYVKSAFQPQFELEDAERFCRERGIPLKVLKVDILSCREVTENPPDRCYHCKKQVFSTILAAAEADGFSVLLDGTNASDDEGDRPGTRALKEMSVLSPLRICG
ncbi:MAG: ATP-binding protein, partial [Eubacteriales bacterium]|nr:ATP-binding protein [Eubacteriales bacterium]